MALAPATSAFAGGSTYYAGNNTQGQKLLFSVDQTANGPAFDPFFTTMIASCPATGNQLKIQFSFLGFEIPIKNGKFSLSLNSITDRFSWSGTITSKAASGPESYSLAALDNEAGLQLCTTGAVSWKAKALVAGSSKPAIPSAAYRVQVTKASDGSVHFTVIH